MSIFAKPEEETGETQESDKTPEPQVEPNQDAETAAAEPTVQYVCPGIPRFKIGRFQFEAGVLKLTPEDDEVFSALLEGTDARTRAVVQKVDQAAGEAVARAFLDRNGGKMIRGGDDTSKSVAAPRPSEG